MHKGFCLNANKEKNPSVCKLNLSQCPKYCIYEDNECYSTNNEGLADKNKYCSNFLPLECPNGCFLWKKPLETYNNPNVSTKR